MVVLRVVVGVEGWRGGVIGVVAGYSGGCTQIRLSTGSVV